MIIYILLILILIYCLNQERKDLLTNRKDNIFNENRSVYHYKTKPKKNDSLEKLLERIELSTETEDRVILWRRCIIISTLCIVILIFIIHKRLVKQIELLIGIIVITLITYFAFNFYNFHLRRNCNKNVLKCLKLIKNKLVEKSIINKRDIEKIGKEGEENDGNREEEDIEEDG